MWLCKKKYPFERGFLKDSEAGLGLDVDKTEVDKKHTVPAEAVKNCAFM